MLRRPRFQFSITALFVFTALVAVGCLAWRTDRYWGALYCWAFVPACFALRYAKRSPNEGFTMGAIAGSVLDAAIALTTFVATALLHGDASSVDIFEVPCGCCGGFLPGGIAGLVASTSSYYWRRDRCRKLRDERRERLARGTVT